MALSKFEGREVDAVGVEIPNAGGGLQKALDIDPEEWHHGDEVHLVLRCNVKKVRFDPMVKGEDSPLQRVHVMHVVEASLIDAELVSEVLDSQRERIRKAEEDAIGQTNLLDGDEAVGADVDETDASDSPAKVPSSDEVETESSEGPDVSDDVQDDEIVSEDEDVPPYSEWKKADLVTEIQTRNDVEERTAETRISTQGSKDDLVARLEADDAGPAPSPVKE